MSIAASLGALGVVEPKPAADQGAPGDGKPKEVVPPVASRFLSLCAEDESRRRLMKWVHVDALLQSGRGEDTCRAISDRCVPPLADNAQRERANLTSLASLATWRAAAVSNDRMTPEELRSEIALRASEVQLEVGFRSSDLRRDLAEAEAQMGLVEDRVANRVRRENEDALSRLVVKRLTLRGLQREHEYRLAGTMREHNYEMKRQAMLRMVQSGMLPIEMKVLTLGAAREEEELNELRAETQQLQQLVLRIKLTTGLRQLRRERVQANEVRAASETAARDAPLLTEMAASERRQKLLAERLRETQRALKHNSAELAALQKEKKQLQRANARLVSYREDHEGDLVKSDALLDEALARALSSYGANQVPIKQLQSRGSLGPEIIEQAVVMTSESDREKKLLRLSRGVANLEAAVGPSMIAASRGGAMHGASVHSLASTDHEKSVPKLTIDGLAASFPFGGGLPSARSLADAPLSARPIISQDSFRPGSSQGAILDGGMFEPVPPSGPKPQGRPGLRPPPIRADAASLGIAESTYSPQLPEAAAPIPASGISFRINTPVRATTAERGNRPGGSQSARGGSQSARESARGGREGRGAGARQDGSKSARA